MVPAAHRDAWEKAGILHHDVSVNNILIYEDGRGKVEQLGILCDWDLCKDREQVERNQKKGMPDRTVRSKVRDETDTHSRCIV